MNIKEMQYELDQLNDELTTINIQLERARAHQKMTGEYADPDWYQRASAARRIKARDVQLLQRQLAEAKRNRNQSTADRFVTIARRELDPDTFNRILEEAND